jgi:hypothetical protein
MFFAFNGTKQLNVRLGRKRKSTRVKTRYPHSFFLLTARCSCFVHLQRRVLEKCEKHAKKSGAHKRKISIAPFFVFAHRNNTVLET